MNNQQKLWDKEYQQHKIKWHKDTQTLPKILKNKVILELGIGNGKTLRSILKQNPKEVTAIDFSKEAIVQAKKEFSRTKFIKSDIIKMPFPKEYFDIVVCYYILNNLSKKEIKEAVKEIKRVLKTNGKILFEDFAVGDFRETIKIPSHTIQKKNGIICHFFTIIELKTLFKNFSKINLKEKISKPIAYKNLKRKIISGAITK
ncbi:MAG: class I SAM-dependent methyltransferase [archaeon]|nr:class I SAM-dependent methyltransferase [archaeon]